VKHRTLLAATLAALGATSGCASGPPAAVAPAPAAVAETPASGAPAPAGSPALAGALNAAGGYLDGQARELELVPGTEVQRRADALLVTLPGEALFDGMGTSLTSAGVERVQALAQTLLRYPKQAIIVKGHTDAQAPERAQSTSEDRADSVRNVLVAAGLLPSRITAIGLGASLPLAGNETEAGRQRNRRVEIELRPDDDVLAGGVGQ